MATTDTMDAKTDIAAVIAWWRDAGVDHLLTDAPAPLLDAPRDEAPAAVAATPLPVLPEPGPPATIGPLPTDLETFRHWWLTDPALDDGRLSGRIAPEGEAGAQTMVVVEQPEAEDAERMLSGPQGRLLDAILAAMGLGRDKAYLATVLPRHMPLPDWQALARKGLGDVLAHHIAIARPERLILFGGNIPPLLGNRLPNSAHSSQRFNHEGLSMPVFAAKDLTALLGSPRFKARLWNDWLAWKRDCCGGQM